MTSEARRRRRIAVVLVDRANYGRMKPVMSAIAGEPALELLTIASGTMLLDRFGTPVRLVRADGFSVDAEIHVEIEGSNPVTMAKSVGMAVIEFASVLNMLRPDLLLVIGDRYEALAAAIAAGYMNIPIAHIQGGEVSGSIDEPARHAITKFAQFHFPATARAADYLVRMGEHPQTVFNVGCPSGDIIRALDRSLPADTFAAGVGGRIDREQPFCLVIFHPITTSYERNEDQAEEVLAAVESLGVQTVWLWPNIDAGSDQISRALRRYRERNSDHWVHFVKGFAPELFLSVLANAALAVGNSSSFVRDSTFLGTPVVLVGDRQNGRERGANALAVACQRDAIRTACLAQLAHGRYPPSTLYGDGHAAARIAAHLARVDLYRQKHLSYPLAAALPARIAAPAE
jgi:UDP-hydrolysing UDP-N-acetyl-D-glucosamine 2-epimerase